MPLWLKLSLISCYQTPTLSLSHLFIHPHPLHHQLLPQSPPIQCQIQAHPISFFSSLKRLFNFNMPCWQRLMKYNRLVFFVLVFPLFMLHKSIFSRSGKFIAHGFFVESFEYRMKSLFSSLRRSATILFFPLPVI